MCIYFTDKTREKANNIYIHDYRSLKRHIVTEYILAIYLVDKGYDIYIIIIIMIVRLRVRVRVELEVRLQVHVSNVASRLTNCACNRKCREKCHKIFDLIKN